MGEGGARRKRPGRHPGVLAALAALGYTGSLCVEREGGTREQRISEVAAAVAFVRASPQVRNG